MFSDLLRAKLDGIANLSAAQVTQLESHYNLLLRWNKSLNLTTVTSLTEAVERHYAESVFLGAHLPVGRVSVVDIGSGPGFPGIPVAIARPEVTVTLVESHQRKAVFLKEATRGLPNVRVLAKRGEDVAETFDFLVSRAVSNADLSRLPASLARSLILLTGSEEFELAEVTWEEPIPLPWGQRRYLRLGSFPETPKV